MNNIELTCILSYYIYYLGDNYYEGAGQSI